MICRTVHLYGQIRIPKALTQGFGALVTLTLTSDGILVAPFRPGDDTRPNCRVGKITSNRLSLPIKYRRQLGIQDSVKLQPQPDGEILVTPLNSSF